MRGKSCKETRMRNGNSSAKVCGSKRVRQRGLRIKEEEDTSDAVHVALTLSDPRVIVCVGDMAPRVKLRLGTKPS